MLWSIMSVNSYDTNVLAYGIIGSLVENTTLTAISEYMQIIFEGILVDVTVLSFK